MRTLIAGGGTGGHLTPALALAQALAEADPAGRVLIVGRRGGATERLVTAAGLRLETLVISGPDAHHPATVARAAFQLPGAIAAAARLIRRFRADVIVGTAGYVCVPVVLAGRLLRVPVVLLEQNALPGKATRLLAPGAAAVAASFAATAGRLGRARVVVTGNPVRREVRSLASGTAPARCDGRFDHLLVMGGSQGAHRINAAVWECAERLLTAHPSLRITHQWGAHDAALATRFTAGLSSASQQRYEGAQFFDDIAQRIAEAGLVLMRAGGSSLAECSALGRPMILVPYPHAGEHQRHNADPYVSGGAARCVPDPECTAARVFDEVNALVRDAPRCAAMAAASAAMGRPDAADRVVELLQQVAGG